jgi:hypothetical protein
MGVRGKWFASCWVTGAHVQGVGGWVGVLRSIWGRFQHMDTRWPIMVNVSSWSELELLQGGWVDAVWFGWVVTSM